MNAQDEARRAIWTDILNRQHGTKIAPRYELAGKAGVSETVASGVLSMLKGYGVLGGHTRPPMVKARIRKPQPGDRFAEILIGNAYSYVCLSCWHLIKPEQREAHDHDR